MGFCFFRDTFGLVVVVVEPADDVAEATVDLRLLVEFQSKPRSAKAWIRSSGS